MSGAIRLHHFVLGLLSRTCAAGLLMLMVYSVDTNSLHWWMLLDHLTTLFCTLSLCRHCSLSCFGSGTVFCGCSTQISTELELCNVTVMSFPKSIRSHHTVCWPTVWICRAVDLRASGSRPGENRTPMLECISGLGLGYSEEKNGTNTSRMEASCDLNYVCS